MNKLRIQAYSFYKYYIYLTSGFILKKQNESNFINLITKNNYRNTLCHIPQKANVLTFFSREHDNGQSFEPLIFIEIILLFIEFCFKYEEKIPKQKPDTSFNRLQSFAEKLKIIKYAENSIHASSNLLVLMNYNKILDKKRINEGH